MAASPDKIDTFVYAKYRVRLYVYIIIASVIDTKPHEGVFVLKQHRWGGLL